MNSMNTNILNLVNEILLETSNNLAEARKLLLRECNARGFSDNEWVSADDFLLTVSMFK